MKLFGKKKSKNCCCKSACNAQAMQAAEISKTGGASIKILGSGCGKCNQLEANTLEAMKQLGMDHPTIDHITDFTQIAAYGVMTTPALVVNGKVVSFGKVLKTEDVVTILKKERETHIL